jgi:uncharacterized protein DUF4112
MNAHQWLVIVLSLVAGGAAVAILAYVVLRWAALRIAHRVAGAAERRLGESLQRGMRRTGVLQPSSIDPALEAKYMREIERLAWLMDRMIPVPGVGGIGLDALFGLLPGIGDAISFGVSSLIVIRAAQLGLAPELISRLLAIQLTDLVLGAVPIVGDVFDAAYKADIRSATLIREALDRRRVTMLSAAAEGAAGPRRRLL